MAAITVPSRPLNTPSAEDWCYTKSNVIKFSYVWTINNFSFRGEQVGEKLESSSFPTGGGDELKWRLELYPKGESEPKYVSVFLRLDSCKESVVCCKFKFSIINVEGEKTNEMESGTCRFVKNVPWGMKRFIPRYFLLLKENELLPEDKLTIFCEVNVLSQSVNISRQRNIFVAESRLSEDLGSLFDNGKFSDVTLATGKREFQAHKAILAARSPVFAAMFEHEMKENNLNRVEITDVDHEVLKEMLRFIYTGKAPNLEQITGDLLAAADKYALEKLRAICEEALCANLSMETAVEILMLADLHSADQLKAQTIAFINSNAADVIKTVAWKNMLETHPHLATEVFQMLVTQKILPIKPPEQQPPIEPPEHQDVKLADIVYAILTWGVIIYVISCVVSAVKSN